MAIQIGTALNSSNFQRSMQYFDICKKYGDIFGVDPYIMVAKMAQESGGNPNVNADGLMQIISFNGVWDRTVTAIDVNGNKQSFTITKAGRQIPDDAIRWATMYVASLKRSVGEDMKAVLAYNMGPGTVLWIKKHYPSAWSNGLEWTNYITQARNAVLGKGGDPLYLEHVMRYYGGDQYGRDAVVPPPTSEYIPPMNNESVNLDGTIKTPVAKIEDENGEVVEVVDEKWGRNGSVKFEWLHGLDQGVIRNPDGSIKEEFYIINNVTGSGNESWRPQISTSSYVDATQKYTAITDIGGILNMWQDGHYYLVNDIDMGDFILYPLSDFRGTLKTNGFVINNLKGQMFDTIWSVDIGIAFGVDDAQGFKLYEKNWKMLDEDRNKPEEEYNVVLASGARYRYESELDWSPYREGWGSNGGNNGGSGGNGTGKEMLDIFVLHDGGWTRVQQAYVLKNGEWKEVGEIYGIEYL